MLGVPLNPGPQGPLDFTLLCSDGDAEDGEQGPIWTFPPTIRPSPHSKLHKGTALHGPQKVQSPRPWPCMCWEGALCFSHSASLKEARNGARVEHTCPGNPLASLPCSPCCGLAFTGCGVRQEAAAVPMPVHAGPACLRRGEG